jgi:CubicO group peptidase (beta-lactamase class C family)
MLAEPVALPEQVGLSSSRLRRVDALLESYVDRGVIAGAVSLVARNGRIGQLCAYGHMNLAERRPMRPNTIFRLASMTKPVVSVAVLMLLEEGKLLLNQPVCDFIPEFKELHVAVPNPNVLPWVATELPAGGYHLEPAHRLITIRDLLTHTSGLGSATSGPALVAAEELWRAMRPDNTLAEIVPRMASVPLSFQPGATWEYSGGFGFDTLARIVEIVSGLTIDEFFRQRIFESLEMHDTFFFVPPERISDVATIYQRGAAGLEPGTPSKVLGLSTTPGARYTSGGGGLAGTAEDYASFAVMLGNGGRGPRGTTLLGRKTVDLMTMNHIGQMPWERPVSDMRGYRFGLGVRVLQDPAEAGTLASRGTFGWAGAFYTNSWIDPAERMVGLLLLQRNQDPQDLELRSIWPRFQSTVYQAVED